MAIDKLVRFAAKRLVQHAVASCAEDMKPKVMEGLSLLTDHVQGRMFAAACSSPQHLHNLLKFLPTDMHIALLIAVTTPRKTLQISLGDDPFSELQALVSLPASPPSLLSLQVDQAQCMTQLSSLLRQPWQAACEGTVADRLVSLLAQVLSQHWGLTSLGLSLISIDARSDQIVFSSIANLTCLRSLTLEGCSDCRGDRARLLKYTLHDLPHLDTLKLALVDDLDFTWYPREKSRRGSWEFVGGQTPPQCCLLGLLAPATGLTSLSVHVSRHDAAFAEFRPSCFTSTPCRTLDLPRLSHLTAICELNISLTASFIGGVSAPLASLVLSAVQQTRQRLPSAYPQHAQHLLRSVAAFKQLHRLDAILPVDAPNHSSVFDQVCAALPPTLSELRQLRCLAVTAEPAVLHKLASRLAASAAEVTQLHLRSFDPHRSTRNDEYWHVDLHHRYYDSWPAFFENVGRLPLQDLDLCFWHPTLGGHGIAALQPLTQLTALRVRGLSCLDNHADWEALAGMTCLERLCLERPRGSGKLDPDCIAALQALERLTSLRLVADDVDGELVPTLAAQLPPQSLREVREVTMALWEPYASADAMLRYAAALPALKMLTVYLNRRQRATAVSEYVDPRPRLRWSLCAGMADTDVEVVVEEEVEEDYFA